MHEITCRENTILSLAAVLADSLFGDLCCCVDSDAFGSTNFSMNLGWISFVSGFGGMLFNALAGRFYDDNTAHGATNCVGPECYRSAFLLCSGAAALALLVSLAIIPSTQRGKQQINAKAATQ